MREFAFKVNLVAVVRVRAADESIARQVAPEVLGAPGSIEIGLTNQNVRAMGREASTAEGQGKLTVIDLKRERDHLAQANRHIARAHKHIAEQKRLIES
jgi:hypothetical protein